MDNYSLIIIKFVLGMLCLILQINLLGKGNPGAPDSAPFCPGKGNGRAENRSVKYGTAGAFCFFL